MTCIGVDIGSLGLSNKSAHMFLLPTHIQVSDTQKSGPMGLSDVTGNHMLWGSITFQVEVSEGGLVQRIIEIEDLFPIFLNDLPKKNCPAMNVSCLPTIK